MVLIYYGSMPMAMAWAKNEKEAKTIIVNHWWDKCKADYDKNFLYARGAEYYWENSNLSNIYRIVSVPHISDVN